MEGLFGFFKPDEDLHVHWSRKCRQWLNRNSLIFEKRKEEKETDSRQTYILFVCETHKRESLKNPFLFNNNSVI